MAVVNVVGLPAINGIVEAGLFVGTDPKLGEEEKLPILTDNQAQPTADAIRSTALAWVHSVDWGSEIKKSLALNAADVVISLGLVVGNDSDYREVQAGFIAPPSQAVQLDIVGRLTVEGRQKAATLLVATKANWWAMNHHVGQGDCQGYVKKVLELQFPDGSAGDYKGIAHQIGHWCSTRSILISAGIQGIVIGNVIVPATGDIELAEDAKLRFAAFPAGCHKIANIYNGARRLSMSPYLRIVPHAIELTTICQRYYEIEEDRAEFHIGAQFLTGNPRRNPNNDIADSLLGRVGTFVTTVLKKSTLAKSPVFKDSSVASAEDYDNFRTNLIAAMAAGTANVPDKLKELIDVQLSIGNTGVGKVKKAFHSVEGYEDVKDALGGVDDDQDAFGDTMSSAHDSDSGSEDPQSGSSVTRLGKKRKLSATAVKATKPKAGYSKAKGKGKGKGKKARKG